MSDEKRLIKKYSGQVKGRPSFIILSSLNSATTATDKNRIVHKVLVLKESMIEVLQFSKFGQWSGCA